ncbi:transmembrane protein 39A isoform X3 [Anabrus simplex]|uniref:transmembrane protein 39A isoform X3 n=1 Tax=Anabrus simplex TaxID=316456 RepID=UPI0035A3A58B
MNSWNEGAVNETGVLSAAVIIPALLSIVAVWSARRWWNNTLTLHSHAVSRRRKLTRDPAAGRRPPPPLPIMVPDENHFRTITRSDRVEYSTKKKSASSKTDDLVAMPSGRRNLGRASSGRPPPPTIGSPSNEETHRPKSPGQSSDGTASRIVTPKHIPAPSIPQDGNITFEIMMFIFTGMTSFLQFLHLYRTVWWLPQSYTRYTMNFYLIDPHLVGFIATILARRLVYCFLSRLVASWSPVALAPLIQQLLRLILLGAVLSSLVWCAYHIMQNHPIVNIFYLCYPISVYFILFGLSISPFFDVNAMPLSSKDECKIRSVLGNPTHSCSMSPQAIRDEVEILKTDFNNRMKQVLFSSVLNAYYAGFVPCCFAQSFLYYDVYWATQHLAFVWLGCFTMYIVHCYPVKYCNTLHRAALHLGRWARIEGRSSHIPTHMWAESTLWHQGALVKHCKELYKAEGISNAAEPGNQTHARFYAVFNNPTALVFSLLGLQLFLVAVQVVVLVRSSEWYHVVSVTLLLFANYYTLFKLCRDYLVCWKVYKAEQMIQDKIGGLSCNYMLYSGKKVEKKCQEMLDSGLDKKKRRR